MIKKCLNNRPDLRVIVTSATIDPSVFVRYFGLTENNVLRVSGRLFPVETHWLGASDDADATGNFEAKAVKKAVEVHPDDNHDNGCLFVCVCVEGR